MDTETTVNVDGEEQKYDLVPVTVADIAKYAKKGCTTCGGLGMFKVTRRAEVAVNAKTMKRLGPLETETEACGCAYRRFTKNETFVVDHKTQQMSFLLPKKS